ncbi:MAG: hypothetical protein ABJN87_05130, partial [Gilvibacter sp.]
MDFPTGGVEIEGDLESNTPTSGVGDWLNGTAGAGGFIFNNDGTPVDPSFSLLAMDLYNTGADNVFTGGSKSFQSPAAWTWTNSSATGKGDINNAFYHLGVENAGTSSSKEWIVIGSDRRTTTGTSYIDFELYQETVETNGSFGFDTDGLEGGRTVNDILLTIEYGSGGSVANVFFYLWKPVGSGFDYVLQTTTTINAFAATNSTTVSTPMGSFGTPTYTPRQFVEGAINLTDVFGSTSDPCIGVSFKTLLIKTKASNSRTASLNDFVEPIQVEIQFGTAEISYDPATVCEDDPNILPIQTGISGGTYTAAPASLDIDASTGEVDIVNSDPGIYTITYTYVTNGCTKTATTTLTIVENPDAPVSSGDIEECEQDPIQTLDANNAITVAAGTTVVWYDAAADGTSVMNPILNTVGTVTYYAEAVDDVSSCTSLTRTPVTLTINPAPDAPVSSGDIEECEQDPIQTLDANDAITVAAGTTIVWYDAATGGSVVSDPTLSAVGTVTYYAEAVADGTDCTSLTRTAVTLTINPAPDAPVSSGTIEECEQDPIQTLDANDAITVATGTTVVWYDAPTGGSIVATPILNTVGTITYFAQADDAVTGCSSLTRTSVTLTILDAPDAPVSSGDIEECEQDPIQTLNANDAITPVMGTVISWYDAASGGTSVVNPILSVVGTVTYYAEAVNPQTGCGSTSRTAVTLTINPAPDAPVSSGDIEECEQDPIQTLDANDALVTSLSEMSPSEGLTTSASASLISVVWYDAATGGSVVSDPTLSAVGTVTYYAEAVADGTDCTSLTRTAVTLTINPAPDAPVSSGDIEECEQDPIQTLDANDAITVAAGTTVVWYDAATGGSVVSDPTLSAVGTVTYYAEAVA